MSGARVRGVRAGVAAGFAVLLVLPYPVTAVARTAAPAPVPPTVHAAPLPHSATGSWIVTLHTGKNPDRLAPGLAKQAGGEVGRTFHHALNGFVFEGSDKAAAALARNPNVRTVVADQTLKIASDDIPTGVSRIRANHPSEPSAYAAGFMGDGVRVAILDTGIDLTHPDLTPNLDTALGANCITTGPPQDGHGHGTHVAGIVAAADNGLGVVGVAPHARLVPFKVLDDSGSGEWSNLICAVDIITGYATDSDPSNDIRVANMSLGDTGSIGTCTDGGIREAICTSVAAGVTYVAAAGNSTVDAAGFIPAAFPEVIAVSAITDLDGEPGGQGGCWLFFFYCDDTLAEFSNYGATIAVAAPGTQITSDWTGGGYATEMGTSMASPHVAGVAALLLSAFPTLTPADVEDQLKSSGECPNGQLADADGSGDCVGKGQWGNDPDGIAEPLVNALNAVQGGIPGDRRPTVHITSPADGATVSGVVNVTATATDDVGVTKVEFSINGKLAATDTNGSDGWSMTWNTAPLEAGVYTVTARAFDTAGQSTTNSVSVQVGTNTQGDWVGHYGADGYVLADWNGSNSDLAVLPGGVSYSLDQGARYVWAATTTDVRALRGPTSTQRKALTWYDKTSLRLHLTFPSGYTGMLHLYAVDWDAYGGDRHENVTVDDGHGPQTIRLSTSFFNGAWLHAPIAVAPGGSVSVTAAWTGGETAVLSGIFLGGGGTPPPPPPPPPPATVDQPGVQGNWTTNYGADGYVLANWDGANADLSSLPAGASLTLEKGGRATWTASTTDVRALTNPTGTSRQSQTWYDNAQLRVRVSFANAYSGTLHLYAVDWDAYGGNRYENVTIDDGSGPRVAQLSTSFVQGAWIHAAINVPAGGSVVVTVDKTGGYSAVLAGLFLGNPGPPPPTPLPYEIPGVQGSWVGTYGSLGYELANWNGNGTDLVSLPAGVTSSLEKGGRATWASSTTDVRALTDPTGSSRRSQTWYDLTQMRVRLSFANAWSGTLHLYAVDWDAYGGNRYENVTVDDGSGPRVAQLSASFVQGAWMHAPVSVPAGGSVVITVDRTGGYSAVLAGLFLDPAAPSAPGAPTGLAATAGNGQVALSWSAPSSNGGSAITGYTATASPGGATCAAGGSTLGCTIAGLTNGALYVFTVTATNAIGTSPPSGPASATPTAPATVPGAPTGLTATPGNGQVALSWSAPASDGGSAVTGYTATASPDGATCSSATLGCTITGLTNGTAYTFTVTATNAVGTGPASSPATATPTAPATAPGAPTGLTATPGNGQVALTWTAPASNGGSPITGYTVTASPGGATCSSATLGCTVSGLTNGTTYSFTVTATNAAGTGPASSPASATPATVPGAPTGLTATRGNGQVALTWTAPVSNGGSAITGYTVTASPGGATCSVGGSTLGCTVTGLTNGTTYSFTVTATNAVGTGPASSPATATPATVPGAPTGLIATPGNTQVALTWTAPASSGGSPITGYTATASPGGATCSVGVSSLGCTISGLTNGTSYSFTVRATNAVGTGPASLSATATPVAPATVPGAPRNLSAKPGSPRGVSLTWQAPTSNGGAAITGYRIHRSTSTGTETFLIAVGTVTSFTDTTTTSGVRYYYKVTAVNAIGEGPQSAEANARAK